MSQHIVICSGGQLGPWAIPYIERGDYLIGADRGALFLIENGFTPDLAVGDFDSVDKKQFEKITEFSKELLSFDAIDKDYTDTELTLHKALEMNCSEITIVGGIGTRMDHTIANLHMLFLPLQKGIPAVIVDEHNEIRLIDQKVTISNHHYHYVSSLPCTESVTGITLDGFKYPLHNATIHKGQSIGVSNELIENVGKISISGGQLFVILSKD